MGGLLSAILSIHLEAYLNNLVDSTVVLANHTECLQANDLIINVPKCLI